MDPVRASVAGEVTVTSLVTVTDTMVLDVSVAAVAVWKEENGEKKESNPSDIDSGVMFCEFDIINGENKT